MRALKATRDALKISGDMDNLMCNLIITAMQGKTDDLNYYLYNKGVADTAANGDRCLWTFNVVTKTWNTTDPKYSGRGEMTTEDVDDIIRIFRSELYTDTDENS
jgi:hypothetical protein